MRQDDGVDCIVRFHDLTRLEELSRCVFSLAAQTYRPIQIILTLQRFSDDQVDAVQSKLGHLVHGGDGTVLTVLNWRDGWPKDGRAVMLNLGMTAATGRYLGFLDYDDVLYPEAYTTLTQQLEASGAAIAFASVRPMSVDVYDKFVYLRRPAKAMFGGAGLVDLFRHNFCPIHSYLLDTSRLGSMVLKFDPDLTIMEDYDFLLSVCSALRSDFGLLNKQIGDYYFKTDGSNTVGFEAMRDAGAVTFKERSDLITRAEVIIRARKNSRVVSTDVQTALGLPNATEGLSISSALDRLSLERSTVKS